MWVHVVAARNAARVSWSSRTVRLYRRCARLCCGCDCPICLAFLFQSCRSHVTALFFSFTHSFLLYIHADLWRKDYRGSKTGASAVITSISRRRIGTPSPSRTHRPSIISTSCPSDFIPSWNPSSAVIHRLKSSDACQRMQNQTVGTPHLSTISLPTNTAIMMKENYQHVSRRNGEAFGPC